MHMKIIMYMEITQYYLPSELWKFLTIRAVHALSFWFLFSPYETIQ